MRRPSDKGVIVGTAVLAASAVAFGIAVANALVASPGAGERSSNEQTSEEAATSRRGAAELTDAIATEELSPVSDDVLEMAVGKAPFDPQRQVSGPYLLPEERVQPRPVEVMRPDPPPAPAFRVLGTVADARGGVAVIEVPGEPPRVLALGDEILGYRVSSIEGGRVMLWDGEGRNISVAVPEVAPRTASTESRTTRVQQNQTRAGQRGEGGRGGGNAAADIVNQAMRRMREQFGGDVRMEMRGDRVILTAPDGTRREISIGEGGATFDVDVAPPPPPPGARRRPPGGGGR